MKNGKWKGCSISSIKAFQFLSGADTAPNLMGRISLRKGWLVRGPGQSPGRRRQRAAGENFFEDRLG